MRDEYAPEAQNKSLAVFVRSLIGLDQNAVNQKFGEFLYSNELTASQQVFVKSIMDYVRENGNISKEDLFRDPFADYNVADLFGKKLPVVIEIINPMQRVVAACAMKELGGSPLGAVLPKNPVCKQQTNKTPHLGFHSLMILVASNLSGPVHSVTIKPQHRICVRKEKSEKRENTLCFFKDTVYIPPISS